MRDRDLNFFLGAFLFVIGLVLFQGGEQLLGQYVLLERMPEVGWAILITGIGAGRIAATVINGHWRSGWSALVRAFAALLGALFWSQILSVFWVQFFSSDRLSISGVMFACLLAADLWCAIRGGADFMHRRAELVRLPTAPRARYSRSVEKGDGD
jgi:hypothetical protein